MFIVQLMLYQLSFKEIFSITIFFHLLRLVAQQPQRSALAGIPPAIFIKFMSGFWQHSFTNNFIQKVLSHFLNTEIALFEFDKMAVICSVRI
jgi:hypothetical protein